VAICAQKLSFVFKKAIVNKNKASQKIISFFKQIQEIFNLKHQINRRFEASSIDIFLVNKKQGMCLKRSLMIYKPNWPLSVQCVSSFVSQIRASVCVIIFHFQLYTQLGCLIKVSKV